MSKSTTRMSSHISCLPDVVFGLIISSYISFQDIVRFDSALTNVSLRTRIKDIYDAVPNIHSVSALSIDRAAWIMKRFHRLQKIHIVLDRYVICDISTLFLGNFHYHSVTIEGDFDQNWKCVVNSCPELEELCLLWNSELRLYKSTAEGSSDSEGKQHRITKLDLSFSDLCRGETLSAFVPYCPSLQTLVLQGCSRLSLEDFVDIFGNFPTITSLDISDCKQVGESYVCAVGQHLPHLTAFSMRRKGISFVTSWGIRQLLAYRSEISHLDICGGILADTPLCQSLAEHEPLKSLGLYFPAPVDSISILSRGCTALVCLDARVSEVSCDLLNLFNPPGFPALTRLVLATTAQPALQDLQQSLDSLIVARGGSQRFTVSIVIIEDEEEDEISDGYVSDGIDWVMDYYDDDDDEDEDDFDRFDI